jgi:pSer/pThr/pTyr-binding forkhead associated (FHA) protein
MDGTNPTMAKLTVSMHGEDELEFELPNRTISIGRASDNFIRIDDPSVSLHHARISYERGAYTMTDLGSTNGTRLNEYFIKRNSLSDADRVRFGQVRCVFHQTGTSRRRAVPNLLCISRDGEPLGYFTPENARENLQRGKLRADDLAFHESE